MERYSVSSVNGITASSTGDVTISTGGATPSLQQVTDIGNGTTNEITAYAFNSDGTGGGISLGHTPVVGSSANSTTLVGDVNKLVIHSNNGANPFKSVIFDVSQVTDSTRKTLTVPDANGTIALIENLAGKYVTESTQTGIVFFNNSRANYGNIGVDAVDFSYSGTTSSTFGSTGESSFAQGYDMTVSGFGAVGFGGYLNVGGIHDFVTGINNTTTGYTNFVSGVGHNVTGTNITVIGQAANVISSAVGDYNIDTTKPLFVVGNGTIADDTDAPTYDPYDVITRSDALIIRQNGEMSLPSYGDGTITGTASYTLQVDSNGKIIEGALGGSQTLQQTVDLGNTIIVPDDGTGIIINTDNAGEIGLQANATLGGVGINVTSSGGSSGIQVTNSGVNGGIELSNSGSGSGILLMSNGTGKGLQITGSTTAKIFSGQNNFSETSSITKEGAVAALSYKVNAMNTAPATATSTGVVGEIRYTATHIYVCSATNTWVRAALATW